MGLRERKKEQTRRRIAETAHRLFRERGFDRVTVAEVAREAEVAEATLFNYFPTKEDLFYSGLEAFGARLVEAVRSRPHGEPVVAAVRSFVLGVGGQLDQIAAGDVAALEQARTTARVVSASPTLRAREQQVLADVADRLAATLHTDPDEPVAGTRSGPANPVPRAMANAMMAVHSALIDYARDRLLADDRPLEIAADLRAHGERAFAVLEHGLGRLDPPRL